MNLFVRMAIEAVVLFAFFYMVLTLASLVVP